MLKDLPNQIKEMIVEMLPAVDRIRLNMALPKGQKVTNTRTTSSAIDKKLVLVSKIVKHKRSSKGKIPELCIQFLKENKNDITVKELNMEFDLKIDEPPCIKRNSYMSCEEFKAKLLARTLSRADLDGAFVPRPDIFSLKFLIFTDATTQQLHAILSHQGFQNQDSVITSLFNYCKIDLIPLVMTTNGACFGMNSADFERQIKTVKEITGTIKHCRKLVWEHVPLSQGEKQVILEKMMEEFDVEGLADFYNRFGVQN